MKIGKILSFNTAVFLAFLFLLTVNTIVILSGNEALITPMRILSVPVLLICFLLKYRIKNILLIFFLIFIFLGENAKFFVRDTSELCAESIFFFFAFIQLMAFILPKFKFLKLDNIIRGYLLLMFCVSLLFLKVLLDVIGFDFFNKVEILLFSAKNLTIIALGFVVYGYYFQVQNKQSILLLIALVCISFSCIVDYLSLSSSYHWSFLITNRITYLSGLYFIFQYIIGESSWNKYGSSEKINRGLSSENVLV
jgi:hypothetical protein